ncbi:MAG: hypothetical protein AAGD11_07170 [Planctomycetota bacterium]
MGRPLSSVSWLASVSWLGTAAMLFFVVGCGGKPATVTGTVTIDGSSLQQGQISFTPTGGGMRASAIIQNDGSYEIRTNRDFGLEIGEYAVAVVSREIIKPSSGGPPMPGKYLAPRKYGRTKTSGLKYTVEKGSNEIDIDLSGEGLDEDNKRLGKRR